MASHTIDIQAENRRLGDGTAKLFWPILVVGIIFLVVAAATGIGDRLRFLQAYLVSYMFFLAIALGGLFFVMVHHLTRAGWSAVIRRIAEVLSMNLGWLAVAFIPIFFGLAGEDYLFVWADREMVAGDKILSAKSGYLNETFFICRAVFYFAVWIFLANYFFRRSVAQDSTGDVELTHQMQWTAAPGMLLFALTLSFASFDWLMSLEPYWFSTMFPVYYFAIATTGCFATVILIIFLLQRHGRLKKAITTEHMHDLGKLLFAFGIVFWAYIAFSQYMLQWYANIPEETNWWQPRASGLGPEHAEALGFVPGAWNNWTMFLIAGHFIVPFLAIISRIPKRNRVLLGIAAGWLLFMCWYDVFWLVMPVFERDTPGFRPMDFLPLIGLGAIFVAMTLRFMQRNSLVAERDPRLRESLAFENI